MRKYIAVETGKKYSKYSGSTQVSGIVLKNDKKVCEFSYNTASYKGAESEVLNALARAGVIPKKYENIYIDGQDVYGVNYIRLED